MNVLFLVQVYDGYSMFTNVKVLNVIRLNDDVIFKVFDIILGQVHKVEVSYE
jgi:hypothetical protein